MVKPQIKGFKSLSSFFLGYIKPLIKAPHSNPNISNIPAKQIRMKELEQGSTEIQVINIPTPLIIITGIPFNNLFIIVIVSMR